jgi:hypothetical protein
VGEARGLFEQLENTPRMWMSVFAYSILLLVTGAFVVWERYRARPEIAVLYATLAISILASILQFRTLRIGIFASIPLCAFFVQSMWIRIRERFEATPVRQASIQTAVVVIMSSPAWILLGLTFFPANSSAKASVQSIGGTEAADWRAKDPYIFCHKQSEFQVLAGLEPGLVMSDLNIGPAVPVFTHHDVVSGPYHRNEKAILDTGEYFGTNLEAAQRITRERGIDYVAYCEDVEPLPTSPKYKDALAVKIVAKGDRLHVFRVRGE